jgi:hydrogenase expression/formation protein HypC
MKITRLNEFSALCEARGIEREAGLLTMLDANLEVGDYVMISLGQVISKVTEEEAKQAWALYEEIFNTIDSA